jgi:hypothetical protein
MQKKYTLLEDIESIVKRVNALGWIFEVSTPVTMKNVVFLDIKTQFVPYRRHITSPLQSPAD